MSEFINKIPLEPILEGKEQVTFDEESINSQKNCIPGPNVKFRRKAVPYVSYIPNMTVLGSLGCNPDQYPKYTNGKYCCESEPSSPQEQLNYVNMLLESAIENVGETSFKKYFTDIEWLNKFRKYLVNKYNNEVVDTLANLDREIVIDDIRYENIDNYISENKKSSTNLKSDSRNKTMPGRIDNVDGIIDSRTFSNTKENERNEGFFSRVVPKLEPKYGGKTLKKRSYTKKHKSSKRSKRNKRNKPKKSKKAKK